MDIKIKVDGNIVELVIHGKLKYIRKPKFLIRYPFDISDVPNHIFNFMWGIILSEHFSWGKGNIYFDELTKEEILCIQDHIRMNYYSNPYRRCSESFMNISAKKIIDEKIKIARGGASICSNGLGKDGLALANLMKEADCESVGFIVGNQYHKKSLWKERRLTADKFYKYLGVNYHLVMTNYLQNADYKIIPWWLFSLPIAYKYGSDYISCGLNLGNTKLFSHNFSPYRTNISIFSFEYISNVLGIKIGNPFFGLSFYGIQRFFIERYPDSLKFQRTCMKGMPNCGKCFECNALAMHFRAMGYDPFKLGYNTKGENVLNFHLSNMFKDTVENAYKKLKGESYAKWLDKINLYAMEFNWNKDVINKILLEHFDYYDEDPGDDGMGTCNYPSFWKDWVEEKSRLFWDGKLSL